jgi:soluble lytic murein transglycosylase-like protein
MLKNGLKYFYLLFILVSVIASFSLSGLSQDAVEYKLEDLGGKPNSPYSLQVYTSIEKYSKQYRIPKYIAYNIAFLETRYQGPFDWDYHGKLTSFAGAKGPMQIMPKTANYITGKHITQKELLHNIDLNIQISMKLLNKLRKQYDDWGLICGYYNTGYPKLNDYAKFCVTNKDYKKNWVEY